VVSRFLGATRSLAEPASLTDTISRIPAFSRLVSDIQTMSDSLSRSATLTRTVTEIQTLSESAARVTSFVRVVVDTQALSDQVATLFRAVERIAEMVAKYTVELFDTLTAQDTLVRSISAVRVQVDLTTLSDFTTSTLSRVREITDSLRLADEATRVARVTAQIADVIRFTEASQRAYSALRAVVDQVTLSDLQTRILSIIRAITDAINLIEKYVIVQGAAQATGLIISPQLITSSDPFILDASKTLKVYVIITQIDKPTQLTITASDLTKITPPPGLRFLVTPVDITLDNPANLTAKIRIYYSEDSLRAASLAPQDLSLYYLDDSKKTWMPIPSTVNEEEGYVEAETTHLSTWTIMQRPIKVALFDLLIGLGEVTTSVKKWTILPYSEITSAINLINMGEEQSLVRVKSWLVDESERIVWSQESEESFASGEFKTIPIHIVLKEAGRYTLYSQIVTEGVESEPVMRTYTITPFDIYGSAALTAISVAAVASVVYLQKQRRSILSQKARYNYPM
jgi:hypothetical protein